MFSKNKYISELSILILFGLITAIIYYPSINGGPIWDDIYRFFGRSEWFEDQDSLIYFWEYKFRWPIFQSYLFLMYKAFGKYTFPYHVNSLIFHVINSYLFIQVLKKINFKYAFWAGLIFLVHPLNVQNVAWIIQVKSLISLMFTFISVLFYLKGREKLNSLAYVMSLLFFLIMLLTKSYLIHFPLFIFIFEFARSNDLLGSLKKSSGHFLVASLYLPFFLGGAHHSGFLNSVNKKREKELNQESIIKAAKESEKSLIAMDVINTESNIKKNNQDLIEVALKLKSIDEIDFIEVSLEKKNELRTLFRFYNENKKEFSLGDRFFFKLLHMSHIFYFYVSKLFLPINSQGFYSLYKLHNTYREKLLVISFLTILLMLYLTGINLFFSKIGGRSILFLSLFFSYLPVSGIIKAPFMAITDVSDHHLMIPLLFFIPICLTYVSLSKKMIATLIVFISVYSYLTFDYSKTFQGSEAFYRNIIKRDPSHMVGYLNLGNYFKLAKRYSESRDIFFEGYAYYKKHNPDLVNNALVPSNLTTASFTSSIYYNHPYLDPYFLLIVRHLASFKIDKSSSSKKMMQESREGLKNQ